MSEIKFKVYDAEKKAIVPLECLSDLHDVVDLDCDGELTAWINGNLLLFTGEVDKNDVEICEGDIVKVCFFNSMPFKRIDVIEIPDCYTSTFNRKHGDTIEIIGNKFDNPELMED